MTTTQTQRLAAELAAAAVVNAWLDFEEDDGKLIRLRSLRERLGFGLTTRDIERLLELIATIVMAARGDRS